MKTTQRDHHWNQQQKRLRPLEAGSPD